MGSPIEGHIYSEPPLIAIREHAVTDYGLGDMLVAQQRTIEGEEYYSTVFDILYFSLSACEPLSAIQQTQTGTFGVRALSFLSDRGGDAIYLIYNLAEDYQLIGRLRQVGS